MRGGTSEDFVAPVVAHLVTRERSVNSVWYPSEFGQIFGELIVQGGSIQKRAGKMRSTDANHDHNQGHC